MLWWFAQNTLIASLLVGLVWLTCRIKRLSPAVQHALWLVVFLKLVTPPLILWPWSLPACWQILWPSEAHLIERSGSQVPLGRLKWSDQALGSAGGSADCQQSAALHSAPSRPQGLPTPFDFTGVRTEDYSNTPPDGSVRPSLARELARPGISDPADSGSRAIRLSRTESAADSILQSAWFQRVALRFWICGVAVSVLLHAIRIVRFRRMTGDSRAPPEWLNREVQRMAGALEVRAPQVLVLRRIQTPFIWCVVRPQLLWPACLIDDDGSRRWSGVIAHELAHLRRRDHWVGWLELVAGCVWWWNPLFWYVRHRLRENAELACDALVVWALPERRRAYAESLIEVAQLVSQTALPVPLLGVQSVARQAFERRLTMILCECFPCKLSVRGVLCVVLLGLIALPGWSLAQAPRKETPTVLSPTASTANPESPSLSVTATVSSDAAELPADSNAPVVFTTVSGATDDARMDALESRLEQLIAEVRALRESKKSPGSLPKTVQVAPAITAAPGVYGVQAVTRPPTAQYVYTPQAQLAGANAITYYQRAGGEGADVQMLSRGTYKLPKDKAVALAAYLSEHMKVPVEAKVDGDTLIVTAAPEAQSTIGQFISLSEGTVAHAGIVNRNLFIRATAHPDNQAVAPADSTPAPRRQ